MAQIWEIVVEDDYSEHNSKNKHEGAPRDLLLAIEERRVEAGYVKAEEIEVFQYHASPNDIDFGACVKFDID